MSFESECAGKRNYPTKSAAKKSERHLRTLAGGDRQHAYRCSFCGDWHNGHGGARLDYPAVEHEDLLRFRVGELELMILREREALQTAQTPTQRCYYKNRITEFEIELSDTWDQINATLTEANYG